MVSVKNNIPGHINYDYHLDLDINDQLTVVEQLLLKNTINDVSTTRTVAITIENQPMNTYGEVAEYILSKPTDMLKHEDNVKALYAELIDGYDTNTTQPSQEVFATMSALKSGLPEPSQTIIYTIKTDVIPATEDFLAGKIDYDYYFASLAYYSKLDTLGVYFKNDDTFELFKTYFDNFVTSLDAANPLPTRTLLMKNQFLTQMTLKNYVLDGIDLRDTDTIYDDDEPYSFARVLTKALLEFKIKTMDNEFGILPFNLEQMVLPKSITFINMENHVSKSASVVERAWNNFIINNKTPVKIVNPSKLKKSATSNASDHKSSFACGKSKTINKLANIALSDLRPKQSDYVKRIKRISNSMSSKNKTSNTYKDVKVSFARSNRREPNNPNKPGKSTIVKYRPDIHLFVDTSGSISERNYQASIRNCIAIAKSLDVDLYFSSFAGDVTPETKVITKGRNQNQIYKSINNIVKTTGGTDFNNVWNYINVSKNNKHRLNIMITDMQYTKGYKDTYHPNNLYYIPCDDMDWSGIVYDSKRFLDSMVQSTPDIRKKLLF